MAREIERKFLPKNDAWRALAYRSQTLRQGYLASGKRMSVRVRIAGGDAYLNIKAGGLVASRLEYEYPLPLADAGELLTLAEGPLIEKTRHYVTHDGKTWEIDEFHGDNAGLVVAEIELQREDEPFAHPAWLGTEVTELERYYNVRLVTRPYRTWTETERNP